MDKQIQNFSENEINLLSSITNLENRKSDDYKIHYSKHNRGGTTAIGRWTKLKKDLDAYISDEALKLIPIYLEYFNYKEWKGFRLISWIANGNTIIAVNLNESALFESFCYGNAEGYKHMEEEIKGSISQNDIIHHAEDYINKIMLTFPKKSDTLIWQIIFHLSSSIYYNRLSYKLGKIEGAARKALIIQDEYKLSEEAKLANLLLQDNQKYKVDHEMLARVYDYCKTRHDNEKKPTFKCSFPIFVEAICNANLVKIEQISTGKFKRLITELAYTIEGNWYKEAAQSIGLESGDCSSAIVSNDWINGLKLSIKGANKKK
jgi:hypothetical protein